MSQAYDVRDGGILVVELLEIETQIELGTDELPQALILHQPFHLPVHKHADALSVQHLVANVPHCLLILAAKCPQDVRSPQDIHYLC
jgi:hypothetical protein